MDGGSALYVGLGGVLGAGKRFFLAFLSARLFTFIEGGLALYVGCGGVERFILYIGISIAL
jgi:hypothetical protein